MPNAKYRKGMQQGRDMFQNIRNDERTNKKKQTNVKTYVKANMSQDIRQQEPIGLKK